MNKYYEVHATVGGGVSPALSSVVLCIGQLCGWPSGVAVITPVGLLSRYLTMSRYNPLPVPHVSWRIFWRDMRPSLAESGWTTKGSATLCRESRCSTTSGSEEPFARIEGQLHCASRNRGRWPWEWEGKGGGGGGVEKQRRRKASREGEREWGREAGKEEGMDEGGWKRGGERGRKRGGGKEEGIYRLNR